MLFGLPFAPLAALMVLALVIGVARLMFTGTIVLPVSETASPPAAATSSAARVMALLSTRLGPRPPAPPAAAAVPAAVLVVGGWGSSCCDAGDGLRATCPG